MQTENSKEKTIRDNGNLIRAEVIQSALEVEDILTESLGLLYTPKGNEYAAKTLTEEVLSDLSFDKKIKLFRNYVDSLSEEFNHCPDIIKQLNTIRETRNQLAHRKLSFPWIFDEDDIDNNNYNVLTKRYVDWKNSCEFQKAGKEPFTFTLADLEEFKSLTELVFISIAFAMNKTMSKMKNNVI